MSYSDDILNLRNLANDWRELLNDDGEPESAEDAARVREFRELCEQLPCEATPDGLEEWSGDCLDPILVGEWHFKQHARELAEECGYYDPAAGWPHSCIDWERAVDELRQDYLSVTFGGYAYLVRP